MDKNLERILTGLALSDSGNTTKNILGCYRKQGSCVVHFLYFANIVLNKLDRGNAAFPKKESFIKALLGGDFLLPDGVALKLLYKKHFGKELPNLNGTDFLPYFLLHIPQDTETEILLYGATDEVVQRSAAYIKETFGYPVISVQNGFGEFDWNGIPPKKDGAIRIFLVGRGSPLQEIWTENNREEIEETGCLVFTVGGLLDFWSGTEKRAPEWMRNMKMEWLYRAISNPKKNLKKTLVSLRLVKFLIGR